jgi:hypothetical protein
MPNYLFDKKFGNVCVTYATPRVAINLREFNIPIQLTKGSEVKVSGVKMPKYFVVGIFAADKPMTIRLTGLKDLDSLPEMFAPVKGLLRDFLGEMV